MCVPISRLAECVTAAQVKLSELDLIAPIVGHVGDGNFHTSLLIMMEDADELARGREYVSWLNRTAIAMEGTCTGEHGIGQGKKAYLDAEVGEATEIMGYIKAAIDPDGIMNPGKII